MEEELAILKKQLSRVGEHVTLAELRDLPIKERVQIEMWAVLSYWKRLRRVPTYVPRNHDTSVPPMPSFLANRSY